VAGASAYRLLEDPTGSGTFAQVGGDLLTTSYFHSVPLWQRVNARYIVQACNAGGCTNSATLDVSGLISNAIGYLKASTPGTGDMFGGAAALSNDGNTLAVGAIGEGNIVPNSGAAYVFTRSDGSWNQQAYLKASNPGSGDAFGVSIALSGDGNTLAVGAYHEDSNATGINGNQADNSAPDAGAAYVFTRSAGVWSQQDYLKASNTGAGDLFGSWIYLSGDGATLAIGARFEDSSAAGVGGNEADNSAVDSGAVYVFTRSAGVWSQQAYLKASNTGAGDLFGAMVTLSNDGNTLAVGARQERSNATGINGNATDNNAVDSGAVYVFTRSAGVWSQQAYLKASNTDTGDQFGVRVALSSDGNILVVSAETEDSNAVGIGGNQADNSAPNAGAAYVFTRSAGVWSQQAYLKASNTGVGDMFGGWVTLSADGKTLAVGAQVEDGVGTDAGAVYVY
jgi:hypothetical protein